MLKRVAGIAVIFGLLPLLGVACTEETPSTSTQQGRLGAEEEELPKGWANYQWAAVNQGWAAYRNEEHGFRFWYPKTWEEYSPEGIDEEVEFYTGFRDPTVDDFQENIVVMVPPYGEMSLASLVDVVSGGYLPLGALVSEADTTVDGKDGHEWVLSWPSGGGLTFADQKQRQVVLNTKGGWYQLTCSALAEQFDTHADTCERIINSLQVDLARSP